MGHSRRQVPQTARKCMVEVNRISGNLLSASGAASRAAVENHCQADVEAGAERLLSVRNPSLSQVVLGEGPARSARVRAPAAPGDTRTIALSHSRASPADLLPHH